MNKTQLQDDLIECNIENQKLRELLNEIVVSGIDMGTYAEISIDLFDKAKEAIK